MSSRSSTVDVETPTEQKTRELQTAGKNLDGTGWNPELLEILYKLLYGSSEAGGGELDSELPRLERVYGADVYAELIHLLSNLHFEPDEAKHHWRQIVEHRDSLQARLHSDVDVRVALVSYFLQVYRKFENPKIVELKLFEQTKASAYRDELTGLPNFRMFREYLTNEIFRGERFRDPLSLIMVDVDDFKRYNDRNGHECGNECLVTIAGLLDGTLRKIDVAARYGGEEFALILPSTSKTGASLVAERTRVAIEKHTFPHGENQPGGRLTVSMGVATYPGDATEASELVRRADRSLYVSKARGKNRVHLYGENRRSYRRIKASLDGKLCVLAAEQHRLTTVNISEGGILFLAESSLPIGSLVKVNLPLPESAQEIVTRGRVVRVEEMEDGKFEAAIRITDLNKNDRRRLARYISDLKPARRSDD